MGNVHTPEDNGYPAHTDVRDKNEQEERELLFPLRVLGFGILSNKAYQTVSHTNEEETLSKTKIIFLFVISWYNSLCGLSLYRFSYGGCY